MVIWANILAYMNGLEGKGHKCNFDSFEKNDGLFVSHNQPLSDLGSPSKNYIAPAREQACQS